MPLNDYIKVRQGFQTSVNIAYDLHNETKVKDFIPTASALEVMENILLSTHDSATARANILIGAYGRGKSHIVLTLLALLEHRNPDIFQALLDDMCRYKEDLYQYANEYIHSNKRLLPVVIQGSSASLSQSFLGAIQQALLSVDLGDIMPETHFLAAKNTIFRWKDEFPQTYNLFEASIDESISSFIDRLDAFDLNAYEQFEQLHPKLTSGSEFNPFLGFGVIELYEKVTDAICAHGYDGLFVVYDEFSKYLESSIQKAPLNDIKMLQDFAEKCARSKNKQMHLLLISHKDISNYIDKLPKAKVDGWKGVSERFSHYELRNNFTQVYEVMAAVIEKTAAYPNFIIEHPDYFESYMATYKSASLFSDLNEPQFQTIAHGCYPLHPVTAYILPRLSELVAQNAMSLS
ncbi:hypothetical protein RFF05_12710 [Bengtsoniella intestinalis]|uniref:hypothetical protein n=1 Tax=Bengtsoniella intestinalis TaxID=3073143 RepID=UPI00391F56DA